MGVSIFQQMNGANNSTMLGQIQQLKGLLNGKDPNAVVNLMKQRNPQFAKFANECQGLSAEQICQKYGVDFNSVKGLLNR